MNSDLITKLPVDASTSSKVTVKDRNVIKLFFGEDAASLPPSPPPPRGAWLHLLKFSAIFALLFYICAHPASIGRFMPDGWRTVGTAGVFFVAVSVYALLT